MYEKIIFSMYVLVALKKSQSVFYTAGTWRESQPTLGAGQDTPWTGSESTSGPTQRRTTIHTYGKYRAES